MPGGRRRYDRPIGAKSERVPRESIIHKYRGYSKGKRQSMVKVNYITMINIRKRLRAALRPGSKYAPVREMKDMSPEEIAAIKERLGVK